MNRPAGHVYAANTNSGQARFFIWGVVAFLETKRLVLSIPNFFPRHHVNESKDENSFRAGDCRHHPDRMRRRRRSSRHGHYESKSLVAEH